MYFFWSLSLKKIYFYLVAIFFCIIPLTKSYATTSSSSTTFKNTTLPQGNYLWITIEVRYTGTLPTTPLNIYFTGGTISSQGFSLALPAATLKINNTGSASTSYSNTTGRWTNQVVKGFSGDAFLMGYAYQLPTSVPGSLPVTVSGNFTTSTTSTVNLQWHWGAALYDSDMGTNYNSFGVTPVSTGVGTPINQISNFIGGGGTGGTSYTGNLTTLKRVVPSYNSLGVPEPETYLTLGTALLLVFFIKRKRDKARSRICRSK